jgi:adenylate cyclase
MISQRRLAAIMFTDIVGYTALMGQDEHNALDLVHKNIKIQKPLVEKYHGKWLKEMGDGSMVQFASALDAVNCAIEIQEAAEAELNAKLRIGIHLGDITIEKDEIYGDGVNIASRIESAAEPGSIFISEAVYGAIKGISSINTQFQGQRKLKNVDGPVRMYKILSGEIADTTYDKFRIKYLLPGLLVLLLAALGIWRYTDWFSGETDKTILVLPMELHTSDSTKQYIARSLTDELIRSLGKINDLTVINSITAHAFEASLNPINEARNRLDNTDYFVKGYMEIVGMMININIGLFDKKEIEIWSKSYQKDLMLLPELTGLIAADITEYLRIKLDTGEYKRITELKPIDPEIYELWVKAWNQVYKMSAESFSEARVYLNEAVDRSPADARVWAMLAEGLVTMGHSDKPLVGVWQEGKAAALRALNLDSLNAEAWAALAHIKTYFEWDYDGAEYCYNKANELNPSIAMNHYHYAWHLFLHDRIDEAIEEHLLAQELDPLQPEHSGWLARLYAEKGEFALAMNEIDRTARKIHGSDFVFGRKGDVFFEMEEYDSAIYYYEKSHFYPPKLLRLALEKVILTKVWRC